MFTDARSDFRADCYAPRASALEVRYLWRHKTLMVKFGIAPRVCLLEAELSKLRLNDIAALYASIMLIKKSLSIIYMLQKHSYTRVSSFVDILCYSTLNFEYEYL